MKLIAASLASVLLFGAGSVSAEPFATAETAAGGKAFTYTASATATNTGQQEIFDVPTIPNGYYLVSWDASYNPQGTTTAPVSWDCALIKNEAVAGTSSATDTGTF
jgi:hypothetical protein